MRFSIFQDTALGHRALNQDRMGYVFTRDTLLMVVADGMGGHDRGEVAAQIALQAPAAWFRQQAKVPLADPAQFLQAALGRAHREILDYQFRHDMPEPPRTTGGLPRAGRAGLVRPRGRLARLPV
jgi:protein phosphatase